MNDNIVTTDGEAVPEGLLSRKVIVANSHGLHARPAGMLAKEAQSFSSEITLVTDEQEVDAKSILDILTLAAGPGSHLEVRALGEDAVKALDAVCALFESRFGEEK